MFDTIADMLRGSAPDDLAHALGTDRTQTRRAMEIGLPALITGLRDKTLEPGGAQNLAVMLDEPSATLPKDLDAYLAAGDPSQGAAMLDVAFGDRGEPALSALAEASGLSTRLLAQVMSVLAPMATGVVGSVADRSPEGLRAYLGGAVDDLEGKGFGRVVELVSPQLPEASGFTPSIVEDVPDEADMGSADRGVEDALVVPDVDPDSGLDLGGPDLDVDFDGPDLEGDSGLDDGSVGTVVEGAFPGADELVMLDDDLDGPDLDGADLDVVNLDGPDLDAPDLDRPDRDVAPIDFGADLGDATEALDVGAMPSFDADLASVSDVSPAGVSIEGGLAAAGPAVALAEPGMPDIDAERDADVDLEGKGLSSMGWLWWLIGAVLGIIILFFAIQACQGSDGDDVVSGEGSDTTVPVTPTVDPLLAQRQATLDAILVDYPNVQGEVVTDVAMLTGTVPNETERALLDRAVRETGLGVNNQVTSTEPPATDTAAGYSLNDVINAQPELSTLRGLLDQAGLGTALESGGEFTLFAPTNDAFAAVSDQLAALGDDPDALQNVLLYHLLVGAQDSATIASTPTLVTELDGETIAVTTDANGAIVLNGSVPVLVGDATARNGVVHIVSGVLLPMTAAELPEEIGVELGLAPITFALGSADLTDEGKVELDKVVTFLLATPGNIEIGGHTDSDGDPGFNQTLSQDRADAVRDYLSSQGIPAESMTAVGFGEEQPIAANDTPENKAKNRRIEFRPA